MSCKSGNYIHVKRLAERTGFFRSVKNGNLLSSLGDSFEELLSRERSVKTNLDKSDLLALGGKIIDNLLGNVADRAHCNDNPVSVGRTVVVEELVISTELGVNLIHVLFYDCGKRVIVLVACLTVLEENISVLVRTAHCGMLGIESVLSERFNGVHVAHLLEILIIPKLYLLNLVRGSESVKEVNKRNSALDSRKMRDGT